MKDDKNRKQDILLAIFKIRHTVVKKNVSKHKNILTRRVFLLTLPKATNLSITGELWHPF
jgi:hypothetical protein